MIGSGSCLASPVSKAIYLTSCLTAVSLASRLTATSLLSIAAVSLASRVISCPTALYRRGFESQPAVTPLHPVAPSYTSPHLTAGVCIDCNGQPAVFDGPLGRPRAAGALSGMEEHRRGQEAHC